MVICGDPDQAYSVEHNDNKPIGWKDHMLSNWLTMDKDREPQPL